MSSLWFLALQRCWVKVALGVFMTQRALHLCIFFLSVHLVKTGFFFFPIKLLKQKQVYQQWGVEVQNNNNVVALISCPYI